jgi:predicted Zn-ribbon and HTH transcriptional regulator
MTKYVLKNMRKHVGGHILRQLREVVETVKGVQIVVAPDPCGWCGLANCSTQLDNDSIISNCQY